MGILGALSTAVSGLSAQSYALENISGNIANSQTVGFKRVDTSFVDLIPDSPVKRAASGSVMAYSSLTNTLQGTLRTTNLSTNMALSGDGYFVVAKNEGSEALPIFNSINQFTRRGDFKLDANGHLVNGANRYLVGTTYNPATGAVTGSSTSPIQIPDTSIPARQSREVLYSGNLPTIPKPDKYSQSDPGSDMIRPAGYATDPVTTGTVVGADVTTFLGESIPGGEITLYSGNGTAVTAQMRWAKAADNTWMMFYQANSTPSQTGVAWQSVSGTTPITFDANGQRTSARNLSIAGMTVDGVTVGDIVLNFGAGGLTQFGDVNGQATPTITQDGYAYGTLAGISVNTDGSVMGSYTNGRTAKLAQVSVAHFAADDELKREDGSSFSATAESGPPVFGMMGTVMTGAAVEESNTDISDEFSKMIVTQQAYSANTRVMSTAQQMLQDVINIVR
ncbi:flagellar hook protein FlgE [Enterovirga aerilata]|uniref:Flagellar hook protein FlgE n=1 Tax=Enterovirga aerilata TaxID=2730920 RepID=A0A849IBN2_9HYPH|nr:flagellar hook-basal body complex protein [Enterovirga sp. DB1703]NNM74691.1 flagellar hook-basal body complex protein [Enterovirga sp. DB1703]